LLRHRIQAAAGILLLDASQQVGRFAQAIRGSTRIRGARALGCGAAHIVVGLTKTIERALSGLLPRCLVRRLLRARHAFILPALVSSLRRLAPLLSALAAGLAALAAGLAG
jgi:hypothetical protein